MRLVLGIWNLGSKVIGNKERTCLTVIWTLLMIMACQSSLATNWVSWDGDLNKFQVQNAFPPISKEVKQLVGFLLTLGDRKARKIILNSP